MEDQYLMIGDINCRYKTTGVGSPVVLIHGIGASIEYWQHTIQPLGAHHRVFAMDLPGFGLTGQLMPEMSISAMVGFVTSFLDSHGLDRVSLVGNSMGGLIALHAAISVPHRVDKLVLVDNAGFGRQIHWTFRVMTLPGVGELMYLAGPWAIGLVIKAMFYDQSKAPEGWRAYMIGMVRQPGAMRGHLATLRYGANLLGIKPEVLRSVREGMRRLTMPTLIVWGHQDRIVPFPQALTGLRLVPGSQLHVWDQCGHVPQIEKPDEFNRLVLDFLAEH